jgi:hypothetical protein
MGLTRRWQVAGPVPDRKHRPRITIGSDPDITKGGQGIFGSPQA